MADTKISALTAADSPLGGTDILPVVQDATTKKTTMADIQATVLAATAPAAGDLSALGLVNGEDICTAKPIFDGLLQIAVVDALPGSPVATTLYFVTTP